MKSKLKGQLGCFLLGCEVKAQNNIMPNKVVVVQIGEDYPFGSCQQYSEPRTTVLAKKTIQHGIQPRFIMKEKIRMLKNMGFQHLVGLQSTAEEEQGFTLSFEYVPNKFQPILRAGSDQLIQKIRKDLQELAENVAAHFIDHQFKLSNIGVDRRNNLKYFLGMNFRIDKTLPKIETALKYKQQVQTFFLENSNKQARPISQLPKTSQRASCYETQQPTWKVTPVSDDRPHTTKLMKKSTCVQDNSKKIQYQPPKKPQHRFTFNYDNQIQLPQFSQQRYDQQNTSQIKIMKMDDLGARINKLKSFMKQVTGKTPTNMAAMAHMSVKFDGNSQENKIFMEDKIMITPNYTQLQKKIAEFRESKLMRAYNEKEILYSSNNQGYQVHTTQKIQNNQNNSSENNFLSSTLKKDSKLIQNLNQNKKKMDNLNFTQENRVSRAPTASTAANSQQPTQPNVSKLKTKSSSESLGGFGMGDNRQHKEYKMLASNDKYCEEFMYFLDDSPSSSNTVQVVNSSAQQTETIEGKISQNLQQTRRRRERAKTNQNVLTESSEGALQIQDRVKKAIRTSLKLIGGLKARETIRCE